MYDATLFYKERAKRPQVDNIESEFVLCTIHRADNTNDLSRLGNIIDALNIIAANHQIILPIHPRTAGVIKKIDGIKLHQNIKIIEPVGFLEMNWLLQNCSLVMTDSGGVQKEAFFHLKPCLTLRDETEWVELIEAGVNMLASPVDADIVSAFKAMHGKTIDSGLSLYGDGRTGQRILEVISSR